MEVAEEEVVDMVEIVVAGAEVVQQGTTGVWSGRWDETYPVTLTP